MKTLPVRGFPHFTVWFAPWVGISRAVLSAVLLTFTLASTPAQAGDTVAGSGRIGCDEYVNADEAVKLSIDNWVLGFFSFANLRSFNIDLLKNLDNGTLLGAVDGFCHEHPSARIADASVALLKQLVASAEGDCDSDPLPPSDGLSLCRIPGVDGLGSAGIDFVVPSVE